MREILTDLIGSRVAIFTHGQTNLPSGGQCVGTLLSVDGDIAEITREGSGTTLWIAIPFIVRVEAF